jgi:isochorismate synthase EntC
MTGISGRMREGRGMRHVIAALHPTPAVAGTPRAEAQELIAALEPFTRGLYAGCVGWFTGDGDGDGDAAVTIRSALVRERDALLWAGAGIVKDSSAIAEECETRAKLRTMLDILSA